MTTQKRFVVFDSDSHVVEPRDVWEKYLEPEYRVLGKHALWREEGKTKAQYGFQGVDKPPSLDFIHLRGIAQRLCQTLEKW
jgi:hypothetical protein